MMSLTYNLESAGQGVVINCLAEAVDLYNSKRIF